MFWVGRHIKDHLVSTPLHEQGHPLPHHTAQMITHVEKTKQNPQENSPCTRSTFITHHSYAYPLPKEPPEMTVIEYREINHDLLFHRQMHSILSAERFKLRNSS